MVHDDGLDLYYHGNKKLAVQRFTPAFSIQVTYMTRNGRSHNYLYAELSDLDAKLLELSYTDPQVAMYALLPNAIEGKKFSVYAFQSSFSEWNSIDCTESIEFVEDYF